MRDQICDRRWLALVPIVSTGSKSHSCELKKEKKLALFSTKTTAFLMRTYQISTQSKGNLILEGIFNLVWSSKKKNELNWYHFEIENTNELSIVQIKETWKTSIQKQNLWAYSTWHNETKTFNEIASIFLQYSGLFFLNFQHTLGK